MPRPVVTRFAPSPSGPLHVGHLLAALQARRLADAHGGCCLLRVEDIDTRAQHPEYLELMYEDLSWLASASMGRFLCRRSASEYTGRCLLS